MFLVGQIIGTVIGYLLGGWHGALLGNFLGFFVFLVPSILFAIVNVMTMDPEIGKHESTRIP
jgi:hypothetical protein